MTVSGIRYLEMAGYGKKWLKMERNGWKLFELAGKDWKWQCQWSYR